MGARVTGARGGGVAVELVLSRWDDVVAEGERVVDVGDASLELLQMFEQHNQSRWQYTLSGEGTILTASQVSLSSFARLRSLVSAYSCASFGESSVYSLPFQAGAGGVWVQTSERGAPACGDNYHHVLRLFSGEWSSLIDTVVLQDLKWLLVSPVASMVLTATKTVQDQHSYTVASELRISALLQAQFQPRHAAVLAALEKATGTTPRVGAVLGNVHLRWLDGATEAAFGAPGVTSGWQTLLSHAAQLRWTGDTCLPQELTLAGFGAKSERVTAERRLEVGPPGLLTVHLWLNNPTDAPVTFQVTEPLHPFYLILLHTYTLSTVDAASAPSLSICDLPSFHALPAVKLEHQRAHVGRTPLSSLGSLSWQVRLEPGQRMRATYMAQQQHVHRQAQPADASRGVELGHVFILAVESMQTILARPARVLLPTAFPDQTMSFNVLTLVSTLFALLTGQLFNVLALPPKQ